MKGMTMKKIIGIAALVTGWMLTHHAWAFDNPTGGSSPSRVSPQTMVPYTGFAVAGAQVTALAPYSAGCSAFQVTGQAGTFQIDNSSGTNYDNIYATVLGALYSGVPISFDQFSGCGGLRAGNITVGAPH